jgi:hypothetical protein
MARFRFEDLQIWREACRIGDELDELADALDNERKRRYAEQLRAAALSVSNNIAEGSGSSSDKDFKNFLNIAHLTSLTVAWRKMQTWCFFSSAGMPCPQIKPIDY